MPPYLAGRTHEEREFRRLLDQETILENMVLTGLRGTGKTVLCETFKPTAQSENWLWVGADMSEAVSISDESLAVRLLTDLSIAMSGITLPAGTTIPLGFNTTEQSTSQPLNYAFLRRIYDNASGLTADKLKVVLEFVWGIVPRAEKRGIVFAYDESQNLGDHSEKEQYPLSLLLDVFSSIQRKGVRFLLVLAGLPTLFPRLVEARTYSERMFRVVTLSKLSRRDSKEAIEKPLITSEIGFEEESIERICDLSGGYPYFIQFICREVFDIWVSTPGREIPVEEIVQKLDTDFFAGRWARATDRQRDLLFVIANIAGNEEEFTVQQVVTESKAIIEKGFSPSHVSQMLVTLADQGLVYKNRFGRYSFAVPLMGAFILRQMQ